MELLKEYIDIKIEELKKSPQWPKHKGIYIERIMSGKSYVGVQVSYYGKIIFNQLVDSRYQFDKALVYIKDLIKQDNHAK